MAARTPLKSKPLRNPGQSVQERIQQLIDDRFLPYFMLPMFFWLIAALEWYSAAQNLPRHPVLYAAFAFALSILGGLRIWQLRRRIQALRLGRDGEIVVAQFLDGLREKGARIFHDIPGDRGNVDHVIVSSKGVFVIETKTLSKPSSKSRISVKNGEVYAGTLKLERNPINQLRAQMAEMKSVLETSTGRRVPVRGAVVFPEWYVDRIPVELKKELWLLEPKALPAFIEQEPTRLNPDEVAMIAHHLSRHVLASV